jgi:hypothetical protein
MLRELIKQMRVLKLEWRIFLVFIGSFLFFIWKAPNVDIYLTNHDFHADLAMGRQLLLKGTEGNIEFFLSPMQAILALPGINDGNLMPCVLMACIGWAIAFVILMRVFEVHGFGILTSLSMVGLGVLLLPSFVRWHQWLFPMMIYWLLMENMNKKL